MPVRPRGAARRDTSGGRSGATSHNVRSGPQSGPHPQGGAERHPRYEENKARREGKVYVGPGRPKGSPNKSKSLVPTSLVEALISETDGMPDESIKHLKAVLKDGKAINVKQHLDVLIVLLERSIYPALASESQTGEGARVEGGDEEFSDDADINKKYKGPVFRKDLTERLKALQSLLTLRNQIDRQEKQDDDGEQPPLLKIWANRDLANSGRFALLVGGSEVSTQNEQKLLPGVVVNGEISERPGVSRGNEGQE